MAILNFSPKKIFSGLLSFAIFFMYAVPLPVLASEISNINPASQSGHNVYNIEAAKVSGKTGFRHYDKFSLDKGDIANLKFKDSYNKFVNLVNSKITINGIVNTMKDNNFYNGHAIFVSPQGFVIGASGVLNVGSLSVLTPSQSKFDTFKSKYDSDTLTDYVYGAEKYKELVKDSHGTIDINGKILSRGDVEIYGDTINIKGTSTDKAGIIAGIGENKKTVLNTEDAAKVLFNELVANNIKETTNFALVNGKVKIVAGYEDTENPEIVKDATVNIENAQIGGSEVQIMANSKTQTIVDLPTDTSSFTEDQINSLAWGVADEATSKIDIKNSEFGAKDVKIEANSVSKTKTNVNLLTPTILNFIINDDAKLAEYFSSEVFSGFDGGRANATVKVEDTTINAKNNVEIGTSADVEFEINSKVLGQAIPAILYGLGVKTVSGIDVIGSTINADGDVSLNALSSHDGSLSISNSSLIEMDATNALVLALLNYSNVTDTHAIISGESEIEASSLDVVAINMSESEVELSQTATVGKNDLASASSYGSGAAFSILFNRSKNEVQALIKDSKVTVTSDEADGGGVRVLAQSLNVVKNSIEASASDDNYKHTAPKTFDQPVKDKLKDFKNKYMKHTIKDLFSSGNMDVNMDQADDAKVQASGVFLWNVTNNSATAKIENSTITAKKLDVKSYTVDLLSNEAMTDAVGEAYYGAGIALIVNDETNNTTSNIDKNSVITVDELNMDAITQLPMNAGSIKFGLKLPIAIYGVQDISFGISMEGDPSNAWDFSGIYPWNAASKDKPAVSWEGFADQNISDTYGALKPKLKLGGFFNNFAQGSGNGNTAALSASVVVNSVENNTTASITGGSNVTVKKGDAVLNAVTSVMGYNAVGIVDYLVTKINYLIPGQQDWKYEPNVNGATAGVGGSVLVDKYTNNATAKIEGSTVDVQKGDLKVRSASEASYLSALATGGTSETFVLDGSVHVQNLHGTTAAQILDSTIKNANNIVVDAGNARISPSASKVEQDKETSELKTKDERDAKDKILNIIATGAIAQQAEEVEENPNAPVPKGSTGTAIGADVNVSHSDRTISAKIDGSTVTAKENITINSESKNQTINVAFAGAFAGGVSVKPQEHQGADNQPMQNAGNWQEMLDNAQPDDDDEFGLRRSFGDDNPNQRGADNARQHANDINEQNNNVDNNGNVNPNQGGNNGNNPGDNNGNMADNQAGPDEARNNFSLAAAGVVDLYWNTTTTESVLTNSTVNVGKQLNVKSKGDDLYVDVGGGVARAGNVGAGAAVNIYNKSTTVRSLVGDAEHNVSITYTDNSDKQLNVTADDSLLSIGVAVGVGISKNEGEENDGKKFSLGGSFNMNVLKDTTEAIVQKATVKNKEGVTGDIETNVKSKNDGTIVNVAGGAAYTGGTDQNKGAAAGIAVGWDIIKDTVKAQIIDSTLENTGNVTVESSLPIKAYSVGIAGAVMNGPSTGYTFDGALITEWYANTVSSLIKGSTVTSSGDVNVHSNYDAKNMSLAGSLEFSNAQLGGGLGIGAVIYGEQNNISANTESSTIEKSKSVKLESKSSEDMKFLAANLGMQTNGSKSFRVNGVVSIMDSTTEAKVFNNSTIKSSGQVSILADYDNSNQGITVVGEKTKDGMAFGANFIGSFYDNTTLAELGAGSSIITASENNTNDDVNRDVKISATSKEYINIIPVSIGVASGQGNAVGADIVVNILKNHTYAHDFGDVTTTGKLILKALDDTTIYERGGVLAFAGGTLGLGSIVYYDWLDKKVTAEMKGNTVKAGDITVQATAENSYGGTKKEDGTWDVSDMSTNPSDYGANFAQGSSFKNWNMAYSLAHGDSAGASGAIIVRVLDDTVKAIVDNVNNTSKSLTVYANDYTIMNTIVGEFNPSNIGVGGSVLVVIGETDTQAVITDGTHTLTGDLSVNANTEKIAHTVLVGGSGGDKVGVNGSVYVNKLKDKIISSVIGSTVTANKVSINSTQKNDNFGVSVSVAGSGTFSLGGILFVNYFEDTTKALVGDNSKSKTKITSANDIEVKSDSDYEAREYLLSVGASGKVGVSGLGIANVMDSTIESGVYNSDVTSTNGKFDVIANRGFNKDSAGKTAFFRSWFKDTDAYKKQGVDGNTKQRAGITASDLSGMAPIVGAINVSAGGVGAGSGSIIVNKARGSLTSKIDNSEISAKNGTNVLAKQTFTNFDAVAAVAGSANGSINGVGVINSLEETVTAQVNNANVTSGGVVTDARSDMNLNQLVLSGEGAGLGAAVGVVVDYNSIDDKVHSYITNTTAAEGAAANSAHNVMINNILVAGGGVGQGLSANAVPIVNKFKGETFSKIDGSTITGGDINVSSFDNLDNLSAVVGVGVAGQGANLAGYAIRNELNNKSKSFITNNSTINTTGKVTITADSVINSTNALFSAGIAGQGASLLANVISNTITSEVEGYIENSTITKSGDIKITANVDNDGHSYRYDKMTNTTGNVSFAGQGAALSTNVIYTNYSNTVKAYIKNTSSEQTGNIRIDANSERRLDNTNIGIGAAAMGAAVGVNAISTDIRTTTYSFIDAKSKIMKGIGVIKQYSRDNTDLSNIMGTVQVAGLGAAAGVALDMTWNNNLTKSEILSDSDGHISAESVDIDSVGLLEYGKTNVGVSLGAVGLGGDYVLIKSGKRAGTYSQGELDSGIKDAIDKLEKTAKYTPLPDPTVTETGSVSRINGNVKTSGNVIVNATSQIKGRGDKIDLSLSNVTVTAGIGAGSVGIRDVDLASNTFAGITGGTVETTSGNVSVSGINNTNVKISNVEVSVSGVSFSGGSAMYTNSLETAAEIKDATVKSGGNVNVVSESTSKSIVDATFVTVTGGGLVAVDLAENKDTNKSVALVTGRTNIDASGKLTIHSTANTDLQSTKQTVRVSGVDLVKVSKNEVRANTICKALIENVLGDITTHGLDIITDYSVMNTLSKSNVVAVALGGICSIDTTGAFMNADFKSGIDSQYGLKLKNTGETNIATARDTSTSQNGMVAKGEVYCVKVSIQDFAAKSSAKAENTATVSTVLKSYDFTTDTLNVNSYLKTSAKSEATGTKVNIGIGLNFVSVDAKDTSNMYLDIAGKNTIKGNAIVSAVHNAVIDTNLSAFNFSLLVAGAQMDLTSDMEANTTGNIGGEFNAKNAKFELETKRDSTMSKSSGSGGIISVSNVSKAENILKGSSVLNVKNMSSEKSDDLPNNLSLSNKSTNTFNVTSSNGSGGFISVNSDGARTTFDTSTVTNIENSNINSTAKVGFSVENNAIIKDEATASGGGFVAVTTNNVENTYTAASKLNIKDTTMDVQDLELTTKSDMRTRDEGYVDYAGTSGGFVAVEKLNLTNTLNQTSEINIQNSKLYASRYAEIKAMTSSAFKQRVESNGRGFVSVPKANSTLNVTNTNRITLDSASKIKADDELDISFDSNNDLAVKTVSDARNFAGVPYAYSYLYYTVNNTLENSGSLEAGNLVDINFMNNSISTLYQWAQTECHAAIASTSEGGTLNRTVNNTLNVNSNADITSGKDVEISYTSGKMNVTSKVKWKTVSYACFGIPIEDSDEYSVDSPHSNYSLKDDGKIVAGQGNSKYMKINRDGTIDKTTLKGFYDDDYILSDGEFVPGDVIKERIISSIQIEIDNIDESLGILGDSVEELNGAISALNDKRAPVAEKLTEATDLVANGAVLTESDPDASGNSDFTTIIQNDIDALVIKTSDSDTNKITRDQYNTIMTDYNAKVDEIAQENAEISAWNSQHDPSEQKEFIAIPTLKDYLSTTTKDYGLTDAQKITVGTGYDTVSSRVFVTDKGKFTVYQNDTGKYVAVSHPTTETVDGAEVKTCDEIKRYQSEIANYDSQIKSFADKRDTDMDSLTILQANRAVLMREMAEVEQTPASKYEEYTGIYSITFSDINPKDSHIIVSGAYNNEITGGGVFSVATSGVRVDNYSTRSLIFGRINTGNTINSGLVIGGKNHAEFADKPQAVSGQDAYYYLHNSFWHKSFDQLSTSGVHYKTGNDGIAGITINNLYDNNHPFASTFNIPFPTAVAGVYVLGDINTGADLNIWNESGNILLVANIINYNKMSLTATNGIVAIYKGIQEEDVSLTIKTSDYIFAANGVSFIASGDININGNITTGYSTRDIAITEDLIKPENLILDVTSNEQNLINLGGHDFYDLDGNKITTSCYLNGTNNMKAIYKDGQIYLYDLPKPLPNSGVSLLGKNVNITGHITVADGYRDITIDNQTSSQLNVKDVINTHFSGIVADDIYQQFSDKITKNSLDNATTAITSKGKLSLNGVIKNNLSGDVIQQGGELYITADNGLDIKQVKEKNSDNVLVVVDSITAGGLAEINLKSGQGNIEGDITSKGDLDISSSSMDSLNLNGYIYSEAFTTYDSETHQFVVDSASRIDILNLGTGTLNISGHINEYIEGTILIESSAQTNITGTSSSVPAIYNEKGNITITSKGLSADNNVWIKDTEGNITITNKDSANDANLELNGTLTAEKGTISIANNGTGAAIGGVITDEQGDIVINNTKGDMTISAQISHDTVNNNSNGMISITNSGDRLNINSPISTTGAGKLVNNGSEDVLTAILIDNQSANYGLNLNSTISARKGDIIINNNADKLIFGGSITDDKGNISITNNGVNGAEISGTILDKEGNIKISSIGLNTTDVSEITTQKGDIEIVLRRDTAYSGEMNLLGIITDYDGTIVIKSFGDAVVGGLITGEKGYIGISNMGGEMSVSADVNLNYLNTDGDGYISIRSTSDAEKSDITGNIVNWGAGHTSTLGTTGISIVNSAEECEGINISGVLSSRIGDIEINNKYGKLTTTADATISNTENGAISMTNSGENGAEIRGTIIATDGNIGIENAKNNLYVNADITGHKGNITIQNTENTATDLTYLGNTTNENGSITVTNNGTGVVQTGAAISNNNGNVTVANNGENLVYTGTIDNTRGDVSITNKNGLVHIYSDITNNGGNIIINNEGSFTEIKNAKITNKTLVNSEEKISGNINIDNAKGILRIDEDALISNTNAYADKGILIINSYQADQFQMYGRIESLDKGNISIVNNGKIATISGDILAKEGDIGITNSNAGELVMSGTVTNNKGNTTITNNSSDGAQIGGLITGEQGDIEIGNNGGNLAITAQTTLNYIKQDSNGKIIVTNSNPDGNNVTISGSVVNYGKGGADGVAILVDNSSATGGTTIDGTLSSRLGDIVIKNAAKGLSVSGMVSVYEKGGVNITNNGVNGTEISGTVLDKEGNITLTNTAGEVNVTETGKITDNKGGVNISNIATDKGTIIAGEILANLGDITLSNAGDSLNISGSVTDDKGNIGITNNGVNGTEISGAVLAKEGDIGVNNTNGTFTLTETGKITDEKGRVNISNTSADKGTVIAGAILDNEGDIILSNAGDSLNISGTVTDDKGNINITNNGANGTEISGTVLDKAGNIGVNNTSGTLTLTESGKITDNKGGVNIYNTSIDKGTVIAGAILDNEGNITIENTGDSLNISGSVTDDKGNIGITNNGANGTEISGTVLDKEGNLTITNSNAGDSSGIKITTTGFVSDAKGVSNITNKGGKGITVEGYIKGDNANININNENSNITIGEYTSDNDKYIDVTGGNVVITQTNGNIINGIVDQSNSIHTNHDLANPNHAYKTLIAATGDLTMNVTDGDVGAYNYAGVTAGVSIDAKTRDFTDSINVNVGGNVVAKALNGTSTDTRLINLRAKESGLNLKNITSDGNVLITASDWKQADTRPAPDEKTDTTGYYTGYSVLSTAEGTNPTITGQNISVISSDNIGSDTKRISYMQDTVKAPQATVSFEAENDINITGSATAVGADTRIYQLITKRGSIDFDINSDADIKEITAGKGIKITQKAQNLTIRELGMPDNPPGNENYFDDILNPHDDLEYAPRDPSQPGKLVIPNYVVLRVLDAMDTEERAESNLIVYSLTVKGNHGENAEYYPDGSRLADVTLMADNIYASSYKAPNSKVHTKDNPNGVKLSGRTYSNADMDPADTAVHEAKGINSYGDGEAVSVDILGVDKDFVDSIIENPQRSDYIVQKSKTKVPDPFRNKNDRTKFYDYDFKADNVYISVNDYATENRGVSIDTVYADNAYINTHDTNLVVEDGVINNYAEFRNASKLAVVDNDYRRTVKSDMQLFTKKTGSFSMSMTNSTIMKTTAPVVDFNPYHLVNGYSSENSFVNLTFKETAIQQHNKDEYKELERKNDYYNKSVSLVFNTLGCGLLPEDEIFEVSRSGAVVSANNLKVGQGVNIKLKFNDIDIDVEAKVKEIHGNKANLEFLNIPEEISNEIMYEYMKKVNAMKNSISSL